MDITKIEAEQSLDEQPVEIPIVLPNGDPDIDSHGNRATFSVLGRDSAKIRKITERQARAFARQRAPADAAQIRQNRIEIAVAALVSWSGIEADGAPVDLTPENAERVCNVRHYLEQIEEGVLHHARFFAKASSA